MRPGYRGPPRSIKVCLTLARMRGGTQDGGAAKPEVLPSLQTPPLSPPFIPFHEGEARFFWGFPTPPGEGSGSLVCSAVFEARRCPFASLLDSVDTAPRETDWRGNRTSWRMVSSNARDSQHHRHDPARRGRASCAESRRGAAPPRTGRYLHSASLPRAKRGVDACPPCFRKAIRCVESLFLYDGVNNEEQEGEVVS